jgi:hypothetical protein
LVRKLEEENIHLVSFVVFELDFIHLHTLLIRPMQPPLPHEVSVATVENYYYRLS